MPRKARTKEEKGNKKNVFYRRKSKQSASRNSGGGGNISKSGGEANKNNSGGGANKNNSGGGANKKKSRARANRDKSGVSDSQKQKNDRKSNNQTVTNSNHEIFVGRIEGESVNKELLTDFFSNFGVVVNVRFPRKKQRVKYAFVQFTDEEGVQNSLQLGEHVILGGQTLTLAPAQSRDRDLSEANDDVYVDVDTGSDVLSRLGKHLGPPPSPQKVSSTRDDSPPTQLPSDILSVIEKTLNNWDTSKEMEPQQMGSFGNCDMGSKIPSEMGPFGNHCMDTKMPPEMGSFDHRDIGTKMYPIYGSLANHDMGTKMSQEMGSFGIRDVDTKTPPETKLKYPEVNEMFLMPHSMSLVTKKLDPDRSNDVEIVLVHKGLRPYGEYIESLLLSVNMKVDLAFPPPGLTNSRIIGDFIRQNCLFALMINDENEREKTITLNVLQGDIQAHLNIPVKNAMRLLEENFFDYIDKKYPNLKMDDDSPDQGSNNSSMPRSWSGFDCRGPPDMKGDLFAESNNRGMLGPKSSVGASGPMDMRRGTYSGRNNSNMEGPLSTGGPSDTIDMMRRPYARSSISGMEGPLSTSGPSDPIDMMRKPYAGSSNSGNFESSSSVGPSSLMDMICGPIGGSNNSSMLGSRPSVGPNGPMDRMKGTFAGSNNSGIPGPESSFGPSGPMGMMRGSFAGSNNSGMPGPESSFGPSGPIDTMRGSFDRRFNSVMPGPGPSFGPCGPMDTRRGSFGASYNSGMPGPESSFGPSGPMDTMRGSFSGSYNTGVLGPESSFGPNGPMDTMRGSFSGSYNTGMLGPESNFGPSVPMDTMRSSFGGSNNSGMSGPESSFGPSGLMNTMGGSFGGSNNRDRSQSSDGGMTAGNYGMPRYGTGGPMDMMRGPNTANSVPVQLPSEGLGYMGPSSSSNGPPMDDMHSLILDSVRIAKDLKGMQGNKDIKEIMSSSEFQSRVAALKAKANVKQVNISGGMGNKSGTMGNKSGAVEKAIMERKPKARSAANMQF